MPIELPLNTMSIGKKVQLLEQVWDNLCRRSGDVRSPELHAVILNERKRQNENGTMAVLPLSEAKERLQKLGKRKFDISAGAEADITNGYWFYERQSIGLGDYFRSFVVVDIESLRYFAGIHEKNIDSIDLFPKEFPLAVITPLSIVALRSFPFSIFDANRLGYANRSTTEDRLNKKMHPSCRSGVYSNQILFGGNRMILDVNCR